MNRFHRRLVSRTSAALAAVTIAAVEDGHTVAGKTGTPALTYWCGDSEEQLTCPPDTNDVSIQGRTEENSAASSFITTCIIQDKAP